MCVNIIIIFPFISRSYYTLSSAVVRRLFTAFVSYFFLSFFRYKFDFPVLFPIAVVVIVAVVFRIVLPLTLTLSHTHTRTRSPECMSVSVRA